MMKKTKQYVSLVLAVCMSGALLGGCTQNAPGAQGSGQTGGKGGNTAASAPDAGENAAANTGGNASVEAGETYAANTTKSEETLTVALQGEPTIMYPSSPQQSVMGFSIARVLYDRLVEINDETAEIEPSLATAWEWTDDLHLKMTLRDDVIAADGSALTANDVLYTIEQAVESGSNIATYFNIDETTVESDTSIILGLSEADNGFLNMLANAEFSIISEPATKALGGLDATLQNPSNGTGKYTFKEWKPGEYILCERNENYWDKDYIGYYKYIKYVFISDAASRMLAVQSQNADIATNINVNQAVAAESDGNVNVVVTGAGMNTSIFFNTESEYFSDIRLRQAVRYLIDPEALNQVQNLGKSHVENDFISSSHPYFYDVYAEGYAPAREKSVEKAKELMAEAGYPNGFEFTEDIIQSAESQMTAIQAMLAEGGITMKLNIVDAATSNDEKRNGDYHIVPMSTFGKSYGGNLFQNVMPSKIGVSVGHLRYTEPEFEALVNTAVTSLDEAEVKSAYEDIQKMVYDQCLCVGMYEQITTCILNKDITGIKAVGRTLIFDVSDVHPKA